MRIVLALIASTLAALALVATVGAKPLDRGGREVSGVAVPHGFFVTGVTSGKRVSYRAHTGTQPSRKSAQIMDACGSPIPPCR